MIKFPCPSCGKTLKAADTDAGDDGRCACGAAFVIPRPGARGPVKVIDYEPESDSDDDDDLLPRRRKKSGPPWLALGVVFLLGGVTVLAVTMAMMKHARTAENAAKAASVAEAKARAESKSSPTKTTVRPASTPTPTVTDDDGWRRTPDRSHETDDEPTFDRDTKIKIASFLYAVLVILLAIWVIRDCRNRSIENGVLWMMLIIPLNGVALLIYLASRPNGTLIRCERCRCWRLPYVGVCPHCRQDVRARGSSPD